MTLQMPFSCKNRSRGQLSTHCTCYGRLKMSLVQNILILIVCVFKALQCMRANIYSVYKHNRFKTIFPGISSVS